MSVGDIVSLMGGSGGAVGLLMLALFIVGQVVPKSRIEESKADLEDMKKERDEWKQIANLERQRADVERQRADAGVLAGQIARDIITGLRKEIAQQ
jgi:hypothetical protein